MHQMWWLQTVTDDHELGNVFLDHPRHCPGRSTHILNNYSAHITLLKIACMPIKSSTMKDLVNDTPGLVKKLS
jgi:hypothetical protein